MALIENILYKLKLLLPKGVKESLLKIAPKQLKSYLKQNDYFFISYPKCGRSWLKLILCDMVYIQNPKEKRIDDVSTEVLYKVDDKIPRMLFTHDDDPMYKKPSELVLDKSVYYKSNVIFLVRDPRDVIVSWYFEYKYRVNESSKRPEIQTDDIFTFLKNEAGGLATIINFYNNWLLASSHIKKFMILRYEDLMTDTEKELHKLLDFIGIQNHISPKNLLRAIENNSFERVKKREIDGDIKNGSNKVSEFGGIKDQERKARKGKVGGYKDHFTKVEIDWIDNFIKKNLDKQFNY